MLEIETNVGVKTVEHMQTVPFEFVKIHVLFGDKLVIFTLIPVRRTTYRLQS